MRPSWLSFRSSRSSARQIRTPQEYSTSTRSLPSPEHNELSVSPPRRRTTHERYLAALSDSERSLIGIARWPDPEYFSHQDLESILYGQRFSRAIEECTSLIAKGQLTHFDQIWHFARQWRVSQPNTTDAFYQARKPQLNISYTPLEGRYGFLSDRAQQSSRIKMCEPCGNFTSFQLNSLGSLDGREIPLTQIFLPYSTDGDYSQPIHLSEWIRPLIIHTNPCYIPAILKEVERLRQVLMTQAGTDNKLTTLAAMHWWLSHAMPDHRGSAAKSEICIRSLAASCGLILTPFQHGKLPDLEAYVATLAEYQHSYPTFFERPAIEQETTARSLT